MRVSPKLSVCIPVYNGVKFLLQAIDSVLSQRFTDYELLVMDDGSDDGSIDVLEERRDARVKIFRNAHAGLIENWNRCLRIAQGEYVTIFHQDDVMEPLNLEKKVAFMEAHPECAMIYSACKQIDAQGREVPGNPLWRAASVENEIKRGEIFFRALISRENFVCCPTVVLRKQMAERSGLFNPDLPYAGDWGMWLRISLEGDVAYLPEELVRYRWHQGNATNKFVGTISQIDQRWLCKKLALKKFEKKNGPAPDLRKLIRRDSFEKSLWLAELSLVHRSPVRWLKFVLRALVIAPEGFFSVRFLKFIAFHLKDFLRILKIAKSKVMVQKEDHA